MTNLNQNSNATAIAYLVNGTTVGANFTLEASTGYELTVASGVVQTLGNTNWDGISSWTFITNGRSTNPCTQFTSV